MLLFNSIGNVSYRPAGTTSVPPPSDSMRVTAAENASVHPRSSVFLSSYSLMLIISSFSIFLFYLSVLPGTDTECIDAVLELLNSGPRKRLPPQQST